MNSLVITAPIVAGKLDTWNRFVSTMLKERRQEYETAIIEGGVNRLRVWHQHGPDGSDIAVVLYAKVRAREVPAPHRDLDRRLFHLVPRGPRAVPRHGPLRPAPAAAQAGHRRVACPRGLSAIAADDGTAPASCVVVGHPAA